MQAGRERRASLPAAVWPADRRATRVRSDALTQRALPGERFTPRDLLDSRGSAGAAKRAGKTADPAPAWRCGAGFPPARRALARGAPASRGRRSGPGPGLAPVGHASRPRLRSRPRTAGSAVRSPALPDSTPPPGSAESRGMCIKIYANAQSVVMRVSCLYSNRSLQPCSIE